MKINSQLESCLMTFVEDRTDNGVVFCKGRTFDIPFISSSDSVVVDDPTLPSNFWIKVSPDYGLPVSRGGTPEEILKMLALVLINESRELKHDDDELGQRKRSNIEKWIPDANQWLLYVKLAEKQLTGIDYGKINGRRLGMFVDLTPKGAGIIGGNGVRHTHSWTIGSKNR